MPQLDATTFPPQLAWLALTFLVMFFLMAKVALPSIGSTLARRKGQIDGDLERAAKLKAEIDVVIQAYERALAEARTQANATVNATKEKLAQIAAERQHASMAALAEQTKAAEARIEQAKSQALANVRGIAAEAATAAAQRLIGESFDAGRVSAAVEQVMKGRA
ncbi:MAG: F0F1 ATP synthase subunit B' [Aliidongia sp.]